MQTRIVGGAYDGVTIDYRMRWRGERWRAIDVVIARVSLVSSYRSQFTEILARDGPDGLIARLAKRTPETDAAQ